MGRSQMLENFGCLGVCYAHNIVKDERNKLLGNVGYGTEVKGFDSNCKKVLVVMLDSMSWRLDLRSRG